MEEEQPNTTDLTAPENDTLEEMLCEHFPIPQSFIALLLPASSLSLEDVRQYKTPSILRTSAYEPKCITFDTAPSRLTEESIKILLPRIPVPPAQALHEIFTWTIAAKESQQASISISALPHSENDSSSSIVRLPLWIVSYWFYIAEVINEQSKLVRSAIWTNNVNPGIHKALEKRPWKLTMPSGIGRFTDQIRKFCSDDWMGAEQLELVAWMIQEELLAKVPPSPLKCVGPRFAAVLMRLFRKYGDDPDGERYRSSGQSMFLDIGEKIERGEYTEMVFNVAVQYGREDGTAACSDEEASNHWATVRLDLDCSTAAYGDSLDAEASMPDELKCALDWYLGMHGQLGEIRQEGNLPCTQQNDQRSCGLFAANALMHVYNAALYPLLPATNCNQSRLSLFTMLLNVIEGDRTPEWRPQATSFSASSQELPTLQPAVDAASKNLKKVKKESGKSRSMKASASAPANPKKETFNQRFGMPPPRKDNIATPEDVERAENPADLIDDPLERDPSLGGKKADPLMERIRVRCYRRDNETKKIYRCASGCGTTYANVNGDRWLAHAASMCNMVPVELRMMAEAEMVKKCPSRRATETANAANDAITNTDNAAQESKKPKLTVPSSEEAFPETSTLARIARANGKAARHAKLNLAIMKLFCVGGLPLFLSSRPEWLEVFSIMDSSYRPQDRETLLHGIQSEYANINTIQDKFLQAQRNLTYSCDGGTNRGGRALWTSHTSTPEGKVYMMRTREATEESHTAEWIRDNVALPVIDLIGRANFAAVVCDSTGNTKRFRKLLTECIPTMLNLADVVHHLSLFLKDVAQMTYFKEMNLVNRAVLTRLHKSHAGVYELGEKRKELQIGRGIEGIGKTRFGTVMLSALSLVRCLPAIQAVVSEGKANCDSFEPYFRMPPGSHAFAYQTQLRQFVSIGEPATKALKCLEADQATLDDVFMFWHAIVQATQTAVHDSKNELPLEVQEEVLDLLGYRYKQMFAEDGGLSSDAYIATAYLNPAYRDSDLFVEDIDRSDRFRGVNSVGVFKRVGVFLYDMAHKEVKHGSDPRFTQWGSYGSQFTEQFRHEFTLYARAQYPYDGAFSNEETGTATWWRMVPETSDSRVLRLLALKLYAVRPNSMAEERTVSTFTWLNSALRNRMSVSTMSAMTAVRQFYKADAKPRAHARSKPIIKYYEVKDAGTKSEESSPEEVEEDGDDDWIFEEGNSAAAKGSHDLLTMIGATINLKNGYLQGLLQETKQSWQEKSRNVKSVATSGGQPVVHDEEHQNELFTLSF